MDSAQTWAQATGFCQPTAGDGGACAPITGETNGGVGSSSSSGTGYGLTSVVFDLSSGPSGSATPVIYVGVGVTTGTALYRSTDAGATWRHPWAARRNDAAPRGAGRVRQHLSCLQQRLGAERHHRRRGLVLHDADGTDRGQSPTPSGATGGFGGIAADRAHPGTLVVTTMDRWSAPEIYRTINGVSPGKGSVWVPPTTSRAPSGSGGTATACRRRDGWATSRSTLSIRHARSSSRGKASGRPTTSPRSTAALSRTGPSTTTGWRRRWCSSASLHARAC